MEAQPYHMRPWDEVLGPIHKVEETDGHCLALIGKIQVCFPRETITRLKKAQGKKIGILRTDRDYIIRYLNPV